MKKVTQDVFQQLLKAGLIDTTQFNSNTYTSCLNKKSRRKKKYVCEQILKDFEKLQLAVQK